MDGFSLFFATPGFTKPQKHYVPSYFLNIGSESKKVNDLLTSPSNQFRDYHTWNRIEKLMPQHWNFAPQTLKTLQKTANVFSNLDFLPKSGFQKNLVLGRVTPIGPLESRLSCLEILGKVTSSQNTPKS